jgi:hypothetical protein
MNMWTKLHARLNIQYAHKKNLPKTWNMKNYALHYAHMEHSSLGMHSG